MYRYKNHQAGNLNPMKGRNNERLKTIALIVLTAAIIVLGVFALPAMRSQQDARPDYIQRIEYECASALTKCSYLSRNASASTAETLAEIRSDIYAMQTINNISVTQFGAAGRILLDSDLNELFRDIDEFFDHIITGTNTSMQQTDLQTDLQKVLDWLQANYH